MSTDLRCHWNILPSVILIKILSYLPLSDRISVCSTCKAWRAVLFYPTFWKRVKLVFKSTDLRGLERSKFIATCTAKKLRSCTLEFESVNSNCLVLADNVLIKLTRNPQVEELVLLPSHCHTIPQWNHQYHAQTHNNNIPYVINNKYFNENDKNYLTCGWCTHCHQESRYSNQFLESAYNCLQSIIISSRGLKTLALGCLQELTELADELLPLLGRHHKTLSTLGLASVKSDPNSYVLLHITPELFSCFTSLQVLTVDYDYVNDELLQVLTRPYNASLHRIVFHVHGIDSSHRGTTELCWYNFQMHNNECSLIINLLHSYEGVERLHSNLLHPSMPLTVLRSFFCEWINVAALGLISSWYNQTLKELQLVDALNNRSWAVLSQGRDQAEMTTDPLVMLAWRCKHLRQLTLIGYSYKGIDLVAISRLRGAALEEFLIPEDCLEGDDPPEFISEESLESIVQDVSSALERPWAPLKQTSLHPCLLNVESRSTDEFLLPILLKDSQPL